MVRRQRVTTKKVKVLMNSIVLKQLDRIVARGYYASRSDAIRSGIRLVIDNHPWVKGEGRE